MSNFNLKKKNARQSLSFVKDNILSEIGCNLINNKIQYINKNLNTVLTLDESLNDNIHKKAINIQHCSLRDINNYKQFDGIFSNFGLQIPLSLDFNFNLELVLDHLNVNGLFCFNLITSNSMKTIKNIFNEIDDHIYNGAFNRFGPFFDVPEIIENLNKKKLKDIVVSTELLELKYKSLNKLRSDFKTFGIININNDIPKFNKDFYVTTNSVFSKIIEKFNYITVEFEIATFTSWK